MKICKDCSREILDKEDWSHDRDGNYHCSTCDDERANPPTNEELNYAFGEGGWE